MENIHPDLEGIIQKREREKKNGHFAKVFWFTGLSGSGKTTIAQVVERALFDKSIFVKVIDGDNTRSRLNKDLGFSLDDREENIRRIAELSKLFIDTGVVCLNSFVSPTVKIRDKAKEIIGAENFVEVFIDTPLEICEKRDVKGLYKKARAGEIKGFTGIDSPYEAPENPAIHIKTKDQTVRESANIVLEHILPKLKIEN